MISPLIRLVLVASIVALAAAPARAAILLGTAFTYQGELLDGGTPVDTPVDLEFSLWDDPVAGNLIAGPLFFPSQPISGGLFTVLLDFGPAAFNGTARWLQISVGPEGGPLTPLTPRQELTPAPHALALPGLYTQQNATSPNIVAGRDDNAVTAGVFGATISGGGDDGSVNSVTDNFGTVGGGVNNRAGNNNANITDARYATVGGGLGNNATANYAAVGGGQANTAGQAHATIGGGRSNNVNAQYGTIAGGGPSNTADVSGTRNRVTDQYGTIGGGGNNLAGDNAGTNSDRPYATVAGGEANVASGDHSFVGGGQTNTASGAHSTVAGGLANVASGTGSFAAGRTAQALHDGAFVWSDGSAPTASSVPNEFLARATGGCSLFVDNAGGGLRLSPSSVANDYFEGLNVSSGYSLNAASPGIVGATISGGGVAIDAAGTDGGPYPSPNLVLDTGGTVSGGAGNTAGNASGVFWPTVGGGFGNTAGGNASTVGGGQGNTAGNTFSTVAGGVQNSATGEWSTIAGGLDNEATIQAATVGGGMVNQSTASGSTVAGGFENTASGLRSSISGGWKNVSSGEYTAVAGGESNTAAGNHSIVAGGFLNTASGTHSFVAGGRANTAGGNYSFAGGRGAKVRDAAASGDADGDEGTFVWADSTPANFNSTGPNQFLIRANGGVGIGTANPTEKLTVAGVVQSTTGGFKFPDGTVQTTASSVGGGFWNSSGTHIFNNNTGNVGVGLSSPDTKLAVNGDIALPWGRALKTTDVGHDGRNILKIGWDATPGDYLELYAPGAGPTNIVPQLLLSELKGVIVDPYGTNTFDSLAADALALRFGDWGSGEAIASKRSSGGNQFGLDFYTNFVKRLTINNAGNVGIGTSSPAAKLDVAGPIFNSVAGSTTLFFAKTNESGTPNADGFRVRYDNDYYSAGQDALVFEKTDGNTANPDGGIAFVGTGNDGIVDPWIAIRGSGNVGVGTMTPAYKLDVHHADDARLRLARNGQNAVVLGGNSFGNSVSVYDGNGNVSILLYGNTGRATVKVLEITGADVAEKFPVSEAVQPGMVVEIDAASPGKLRLSRSAYNRRVAGVVSGAGDLPAGAILGNLPGHEDAPPVALSGRVWVRCDATAAAIEPGDLLTTSDTPGHAAKVVDYPRAHGAVIGKAMSGLDAGQNGLVLVLVNLQ